jgi:hypothetical protein
MTVRAILETGWAGWDRLREGEGEAKDARGHGSEKRGMVWPGHDEMRQMGRDAGAVYHGVDPLIPSMGPHAMFTDLTYGSTVHMPMGQVNSASVKQALDDKRAQGGQRMSDEERAGILRKEKREGEEAKDARGHGSEKRGVLPSGDQSTAHKGYVIKHNQVRDEFYIQKGGQHISTHKSVDDAKQTIDRDLTAESEAKDARGHGSDKRSKFAPASHEEPSPVRVETPRQRAERIRAMKVPADRAAVIRKAMGYREVKLVRAEQLTA